MNTTTYTAKASVVDGEIRNYCIEHTDPECAEIRTGATIPAEMAKALEPWPCGTCITTAAPTRGALGDSIDRPERTGTGTSAKRAAKPRRDVRTDKVEPVSPEDFATLVESRKLHGLEKFDVADVTPELHAFAERYARTYEGTFEYMLDMRAAMVSYGRLTPGQAKGTLNCARADVLRQSANTTPATPAQPKVELVDGFYQTVNGEQVFKIQWNQAGTALYGKLLTEDGSWTYDKTVRRTVEAGLQDGTVISITQERASQFGHLYGKCMICSRRLTDEASIAAGIGPVCSARQGW